MPNTRLSGVIAAIATPIDPVGRPDTAKFERLARYLLDNGCDGLNVLGTTGEATLLEARTGGFAGYISATANLNSAYCAKAFKDGDAAAHATAVSIRKLFDGKPLVPGIKALLAKIHGDAAIAKVKPPISTFSDADSDALYAAYKALVA